MKFGRLSSWVNGAYVPQKDSETITSVYPATLQDIYALEIANKQTVEFAVSTAKQAQKAWQKLKGAERGKILYKAAQLLTDHKQELAELEVWDTGKPIAETVPVDVPSAVEALEYFAGLSASITGEHYQLGDDFAYTRREPLGVVAGIGAWNYPLQIACWKAAPALAAGNAMIFKPSERTSLTALRLAELFVEAGLPKGLFNVVLGDGSVGKQLVQHRGIAKVSLTGSVNTGKSILAMGAETLKHTTLELGGKSPLIVFEDADLDKAIQATMDANFFTQGEICSNGTRVFVEESIYNEFSERLVKATQKLKIGDPFDMDTEVGSLIDERHLKIVQGFVERGKQAGAKVLVGGERYGTEGAFMQPTIFTECSDDMELVQEEIFGPVMSLLSFKTEEEVIARANDTDYGLAAGVFTSDLTRGHRMAGELEAGICWLNTYNLTPLEIPFGGYKHSGLGRENSAWALHYYTQLKTVYVSMG